MEISPEELSTAPNLHGLLQAAAREQRTLTGRCLTQLRLELGRRAGLPVRRNPRANDLTGAMAQHQLEALAREHGIPHPLTARMISLREQKPDAPLSARDAHALAAVVQLVEEGKWHGVTASKSDAAAAGGTYHPRFSYRDDKVLQALTDTGLPAADAVECHIRLVRPSQAQLEELVETTAAAPGACNGVAVSLASVAELAMMFWIRVRGLRWHQPAQTRLPVMLEHLGHAGTVYRLASGDFQRARAGWLGGGVAQQDPTHFGPFDAGASGADGTHPNLACDPVGAPWVAPGALSYELNARGACDVTIGVAALRAVAPGAVRAYAALPLAMVAHKLTMTLSIAPDAMLTGPPRPEHLAFRPLPIRRGVCAPGQGVPQDALFEPTYASDRKTGAMAATVTLLRPRAHCVYGFCWQPSAPERATP